MIIITMQRLTMDGKPVVYDTGNENGEDYEDWFCVIETKEEELVYDKFISGREPCAERLWNMMVKHAGIPQGLAWGDDDVWGYIRPDESYPEVLEKYTDSDGDVWLRKE